MLKRYFDSRRYLFRIVLPLALLLFLSGGSLYYWKSNSVRLTADGKTRRIFTQATDLRGFLAEQRIMLGPDDFTVPSLEAPIGHRTAVKLTRVTNELVVQVIKGKPVVTWQKRTRENLRRTLTERGYAMVTTKKTRVTRHDGAEIEQKVLSKETDRVPFYNLILLDKNGRPAKRYDLLKCRKLLMRSTGYFVGEKTVPGNVTFLGYKLKRGHVAVDPKVIPLRSRLYVEGYGYAYASDTGSAIKKLRIDLAVSGRKEEARYNRKNVPVYILEKSRSW